MIEIITLQPNQWKEYRDLRLRALQEEPHAYASTYKENAEHPNEYWMKRLEDALEGKSQWLVFARQNSKIVGMVGAYQKQEKDTVDIIALYVDKEIRGQGVSKMLMNDIISRIKQNKSIKRLVVGVNVSQIPALNLYKSLGFEKFKEYKMILGDGKEYECYDMEKTSKTLI